ncbi:hypothetical protein K493DRAFT_297118 [Basidiobolus meristosporus CBS 931.73]|uniref:Uncharacterized protein n=1 Tax=Basidiobolus meristosporus CBS 931.73 TaxID=1314790 RepID=A0A1Y1Z1J4_9FUNG|nr:hypothetical protein K493DRAFT_297118 [Basidiobolus meristosporus CBS 931.73]|eukprot:ORY04168.1 hypothetical protein K493DRAFT_297118 [Basidiobolus meristosporus CBS 931.73]
MLFETSASNSDAPPHAVNGDSGASKELDQDHPLENKAIQPKSKPSHQKTGGPLITKSHASALRNRSFVGYPGPLGLKQELVGTIVYEQPLEFIADSWDDIEELGIELAESEIGFPSFVEIGDYPLSNYFASAVSVAPGSQVALFPDGQLRYVDSVLDGGDTYIEQAAVDLPTNVQTTRKGAVERPHINVSAQLEKSKEFQILDAKLDQLTLALSEAVLRSTKGGVGEHHTVQNTHVDGVVEGMDELNRKITELARAVGIVSEQNTKIQSQTSRVLGASSKTLFEMDSINAKLSEIKKGLNQVSAKESRIEQQQNRIIVRSAKDMNEINERITDLLRAVGNLPSYSSSNQDITRPSYSSNSSQELREIRGNLSRMEGSITSISNEVSSFLSRLDKSSLQDNEGVYQLRKEFDQFKDFIEQRLNKSTMEEKQNHAETVQLISREYTQMKDLNKRVDGLFTSLKLALQQLRQVDYKDADYAGSIRTVEELIQRLGKTSNSLDMLVKREMNLINNTGWSSSGGSIDSEKVVQNLEGVKQGMKTLAAQQTELLERFTDGRDSKEYGDIARRLSQLQQVIMQLVSKESNYYLPPRAGNYPQELVRDIGNLNQNIVNLSMIIRGLVNEQGRLIKLSDSNEGLSDDHWKRLNGYFERLWNVVNMLATQKNWIKQQTDVITKMDHHVTEIGTRLIQLLDEQSKLQKVDMAADKNLGNNITLKLEQLRRTVNQLIQDQQVLLGRYENGKNSDRVRRDIQSVNYKLADLGSVVTRLLQEQRILASKIGSQSGQPNAEYNSQEVQKLSMQIERLGEVINLLAYQQKELLRGKAIPESPSRHDNRIAVLDSKLNSLGQRMDHLITQQRAISERFGSLGNGPNHDSEEYRNLEAMLNQLRYSVTEIIKEQRVLIRGSGGKIPAGLERVIEMLAEQSSRIYNVVERISAEQEQVLKNDQGEAQSVQLIHGKLNRLNDVLALITRQQSRILGGDFSLRLKDYSGDINKIGQQLANLRTAMGTLIQQQRNLLSNEYVRNNRGNLQTDKQLERLSTVVYQLVQDQEKLLSLKINGNQDSGLERSVANMNERVAKLSFVIDRLVNQQNEILSHLSKENAANAQDTNKRLDLIMARFGQLNDIAALLNRQQNVLLNIPKYFSLIESQSKDIKRLGAQTAQIQNSINGLIEWEKSHPGRGNADHNYGDQIRALTGLYRAVQRLTDGQDQLFAYVASNISGKRLGDIENMTRRLLLLNQAIQHVVEEESALLRNVNSRSEDTQKIALQINAKIGRLNMAVNDLTKYQAGLLKAVNMLWRSQDNNFRLVNQKLNALGSDVTKLISQQQKLVNYEVHNGDSNTNARLFELEKAVSQLIDEQRRLILAKSNAGLSTELKQEIANIEAGLNQLGQFIRVLLLKQDQLLQYKGQPSPNTDAHNYNEQFEQLFDIVSKLAQSQSQLITRNEIVRFFDGQNRGIQSLSFEVGKLNNKIDQVLKQQEALYEQESTDAKRSGVNDGRLFAVLQEISRNARLILEQQNALARNVHGDFSEDVAKEAERLRAELSKLSNAIGQIFSEQQRILLGLGGGKAFADGVGSRFEKLTAELIQLNQGISRTSVVQLEILKRIGALGEQQMQTFKNVSYKLTTLGNRVQQLVNGQQALMGQENHNTASLDKTANELAELRDIVFKLVNQQTAILQTRWKDSYNQKVPFAISVINAKITKLSDTVDRLLAQQSALRQKEGSAIAAEVNKNAGYILDSIRQLGSYVKNLYAEQTQILLTHTELLKQNLRKTDKVDNELLGLARKVDEIVRIQAMLLRRVGYSGDRVRDSAIIEKLTGLQNFINQLVVQQGRLFNAKLNGRVPEEVVEELRKLDSRFGELIQSVNQFSNSQMAIIARDSSRKVPERLINEIHTLSEQLNGLTGFVRDTFAAQAKIFNNDQVVKILQVQSSQINNLDRKLNDLNSRFASLVEQQSVILTKLDSSNGGSGEETNKVLRPIYGELRALRDIVAQIIGYQKQLGNPEVGSQISREALAVVENLNSRFSALGNLIAKLSQGQSNLLQLERKDDRHLTTISKYVSDIAQEFGPLKNAVNQILSEQSELLRRDDVVKVLQQQAESIEKMNQQLEQLRAQMTKLLTVQTEILRANGPNQAGNNSRMELLIQRFTDLSSAVNNIVRRQGDLTRPQVISHIPKQIVDEIQTLSKLMFNMNEQVRVLSNRQNVIIQNQKRGQNQSTSENKIIHGEVNALNDKITGLGEAINAILVRQDKIANDERVLDAIKAQNMHIQSLGAGVNNLRRELGALIVRQQELLRKSIGNTQQNGKGIGSIIEELRKLDDRVENLFEQQKILVNKEVYAAIPREFASQIDRISSQIQELQQVVTEVAKEQVVILQRGVKNNESAEFAGLNQRFNQLTSAIARIIDGQSRITSNEKVVQILERHSQQIQKIDNRLAQLGNVVDRILGNQLKLIQDAEYQKNASKNGENLEPVVENLRELQEAIKYLIEQQRKLNRPNIGNALPNAIISKVNEINVNLSGMNDRVEGMFQKQANLIESTASKQSQHYVNAINSMNQNINSLGNVIRTLVGQQTKILRNEEVLRVIASELGDLKEVKSSVKSFGNQIRNLVEQQKMILANIWNLNQKKDSNLDRELLGRLAVLSRTVDTLVDKQSTLLNGEVISAASKEILQRIGSLNQRFNSINGSLGSISDLQKQLVYVSRNLLNQDMSPKIATYLSELRKRFNDLIQVVASISDSQRELMGRKELLNILRTHSRDIRTVGRAVQAVDEKVGVLINQQKELYDLIERKGYNKQSPDGRNGYSIIMTRLQGLEKSIGLLLAGHRRLEEIEKSNTKQVTGQINGSTQFLGDKLGRLSAFIDQIRAEQQSIIGIVQNTNAVSSEIINRVTKVDGDIKNLDDVLRQLGQEQHEVNVKVTQLLGLPQDLKEVKQRLVSLSNLTNKLINQQMQLYQVTVDGNRQPDVNVPNQPGNYDRALRYRLSELFQLMQQLTIQQNSLMKAENKNSQKHSQEISALASRVFKVEQTVTSLLGEQQRLLERNYKDSIGGLKTLDNKFDLLNEAVRQLVDQQQKIMKLAGLGRLVVQQSKDIRGVRDKLTILTDVVNQLVNQQKDLLVRTRYEQGYITNNELERKFAELKDTVLNIVKQQRIIVERDIYQRERNGSDKSDNSGESISSKLEYRVEQVTDLMKQLVLQQKETILHLSRKSSSNSVRDIGQISSKILQLNELTKQLFAEQTSVIQRGFDSLSKQQVTGFQRIDYQLEDLRSELKKFSNRGNDVLDRRIQALSQQQSRDTNQLNNRLSQISKMLERIAKRPAPQENKGLTEIRAKLNRLENAISRILGKLDKGGNVHLSQEQIEELIRVSHRLPNINKSVENLALIEEIGDPDYIQELVEVEQSLDEYGKTVVGISGSMTETSMDAGDGFVSNDLDVLDINSDGLFGDDDLGLSQVGDTIVVKGSVVSQRRVKSRNSRGHGHSLGRGRGLGRNRGLGRGQSKMVRGRNAGYATGSSKSVRKGKSATRYRHSSGLKHSVSKATTGNRRAYNSPSSLHNGYEYRQGFWYPENKQFEKISQGY